MPKKKVPVEPEDKQKCKKVKDPCKICLQTVTPHTGLQCQGACEAWVHYECLNYTPGKIKDIEEGIITITCPCPDCKTTVPKEFLTAQPFTCNNIQCPANNPPSCDEADCQANELSRKMPARCPPPGTLRQCGMQMCREYAPSIPNVAVTGDNCMDGYNIQSYCSPKPLQQNTPEQNVRPIPVATPQVPSEAPPTTEVMQQMCKTVGELAQQLTHLIEKMNGGGPAGPMYGGGAAGPMHGGGAAGPMHGGGAAAPMQQMSGSNSNCAGGGACNKCNKGMDGSSKNCSGGCGKSGQSKCSQPCYCPGNPIQKR